MNDYISRQAALHYIADWQYGEANVGNETVYDNIEKCYKMIEQLPSVQPYRGGQDETRGVSETP